VERSETQSHTIMKLLFCLFALAPILAFAQNDSTKLNAKFRFRDGIYWSAKDLKTNKPNLVSDDLTKNAVVTNNVIQVSSDPKQPELKTAWCIVKNGVPYIRYAADSTQTEAQTFYKLQLQGKICYFSYTRSEFKQVPMNVFDPQSGRLIYTSYIRNRENTIYRYITHFSDGAIVPLSRKTLAEWTADDKKLALTIAELKDDDELNSRLFKSVLVYNDRNFVWVKK
jgi:hypothetical protein